MSYASEHPYRCTRDDCEESVPGGRWSVVRAQQAGWFFGKNGQQWCPAHVPAWVAKWRARKEGGSR